LFKLYLPARCRLCADATAEFADIALADPWVKDWCNIPRVEPGWSFVLARTERGLGVLEDAARAGQTELEPFDAGQVSAQHANMVTKKQVRAFFLMERRGRRGLPEGRLKGGNAEIFLQ
jgi:coenzyme F420-reducing hydrogenase beta subunit